LTISCSGDSPSEPPIVSGSLVIEPLTPSFIETRAGTVLHGPRVRIVERRSGKPVANAPVQFRPGPTGGGLRTYSTYTDGSGIASAGEWTVSVRSGPASCIVTVNGILFTFVAVVKPDVPARFEEIHTATVGFAGEEVDPPPLRLLDKFGNATPGISVTLTIGAETSTVVTNDNGNIPSMRWRLASTPGDNTIIASVNGMEPVTFHAQGLDRAALDWYDLETITVWASPVSPADEGISRSRFGITRFDRCLCKSETGFFITEIEYGGAGATRFSGAYRIESGKVHLLAETAAIITSFNESASFLLDQSIELDGNRIGIGITRWHPEWEEMLTEAWVYQLTANSSDQK
jgi:hypothetical protein